MNEPDIIQIGPYPFDSWRGGLDRADILAAFRKALLAGEAWQIALLAAIRVWNLPYEEVNGRWYQYLLMGEAFDWLTLAERLLSEVDELVPQEEREGLLLLNRFPREIPDLEFKNLLGVDKYRAYLNFFYGVVVEESLLLSVEEEVRKQRRSKGLSDNEVVIDRAYSLIYGAGRDSLISIFRQESGCVDSNFLTLTQLKEFTYWLFRHRIKSSDSSRVASDTKKGLVRLLQIQSL
jgi:hypothetical protein